MVDLSILQIVATDPDKFIAYAGEVMLASKREGQRWSVTFDLSMEEDSHPFNRYTGKATGKPGTRFMALLVEIDDQDKPVDQDHKSATAHHAELPIGKALVKESGILRNDLDFTRFLWWKFTHLEGEEKDNFENDMTYGLLNNLLSTGGKSLSVPKTGKRFNDFCVHHYCDVLSCREFKYNKSAADKFNQLRSDFILWANKRQKRG